MSLPTMTELVAGGWREKAACRLLPTKEAASIFFPVSDVDRDEVDKAERAKAVCRSCPVMLACRAAARVAREPHGVWGGETEQERRRFTGQRRRRY